MAPAARTAPPRPQPPPPPPPPRAAASLTNGSCGTYGSPTTIVGSPAQSLPTGCYLYTLTGTDNLGNTASVTATVEVDTSDPSAPTFSFSNFTGTTSAVANTVFF